MDPVARSLTLKRLQAAIENISMMLEQEFSGDRGNVIKYLRRAEASLKSSLQAKAPRAAGPGPRLAAWQVRRAREHIDANLGTTIRNRELAALVGLSEFHFSVAFRNSVGTSPHDYLIQQRMDRARQLMLTTGKPLSEIAFECGLADQAHLTRLFRRVTGETPATWRRAQYAPGGAP